MIISVFIYYCDKNNILFSFLMIILFQTHTFLKLIYKQTLSTFDLLVPENATSLLSFSLKVCVQTAKGKLGLSIST